MLSEKEQIEILKGTRVLSRRGVKGHSDVKLTVGDLVFDSKNKEYGILLGIKPDLEGEISKMKKLSTFDKIPLETYPEGHLCILMTLNQDKENFTSRVRYTNSKFLKRLEDSNTEELSSDLEYHCQNQCFLECDKGCTLWKYRTSKKP